jgi:hypothetical protein
MIHPLLAQVQESTSAGTWGAFGAIVTMILVQVGKMLSDWRKDKRDLFLDIQKASFLERIAKSNEDALRAQLEVKVTLQHQAHLDDQRHKDLLVALNQTCKYK